MQWSLVKVSELTLLSRCSSAALLTVSWCLFAFDRPFSLIVLSVFPQFAPSTSPAADGAGRLMN